MPVIKGKGPSWLEGGKTLIASGKKPEKPSTPKLTEAKPEPTQEASARPPPDLK